MSSEDIAIRVSNLSKCYQIYDNPRDRLKQFVVPRMQRLAGNASPRQYFREFWALKDVSFEIKKGETVGIIGRNGSGKSTLLQMVCGTLNPTSGTIQTNGRIAALLELGSGFNPEFTGRENVYMNAAVLGMSTEEINVRFDAIAAFADIGDFIEQPVKTYSSGMVVRLAFAVAINVDPEILIVDEALSVGDEAFQRKCFSRITNFQKQGKTILFVSHSAAVIVELCNKALLIDQGELLLQGTPKLVVSKYQHLIYSPAEKVNTVREEIRSLNNSDAGHEYKAEVVECEKDVSTMNVKPTMNAYFDSNLKPQSTIEYESRGARINSPYITTLSGEKVNVLVRGEEYVYAYSVQFEKTATNVRVGTTIKTISGLELGGIGSPPDFIIEQIKKETVLQVKIIFKCVLLPNVYFMNAGILGTENGNEVFLHRLVDALMFRVQPEQRLFASGTVDFSSNQTDQVIDLTMQKIGSVKLGARSELPIRACL